jgi:hypothetical protein
MIFGSVDAVTENPQFHSWIIPYRRRLIHPRASPWNSALRADLSTIASRSLRPSLIAL